MGKKVWNVSAHNGFYIDENGEQHHSPFLEAMLRVVSKHTTEEYNEFAVGSSDAHRLRTLLNSLEQDAKDELRTWRLERSTAVYGNPLWLVTSYEGVKEVRATCILMEDAERIVSDHTKAARLEEAEKALRELLRLLGEFPEEAHRVGISYFANHSFLQLLEIFGRKPPSSTK